MARFHNIEHQVVVETLTHANGLAVERVRRFDHTTALPTYERWSGWAFRIMLGGTRYVEHDAQVYTLAPSSILWQSPLDHPVRLRALPGTSADHLVVRWSDRGWRRWLSMQPGFAQRHETLMMRRPVVALGVAPPQVLLVIRDLLALNEALRPSAYAMQQHAALLLHLLGGLHFDRHPHAAPPEQRRRVEAAQAYLARDLSQPPSLIELASALNVSPRQLQRDFVTCTGLTPRRYLNIMRLSEANALLSETNLPIATIAARLGYVSQTHFSTAFRQVYQCSPRQLRAAMHGQVGEEADE
ncbi:MAG TPA: AraC family transcriptional regulator [Herpetosiphonaceae bacterium]